MTAWSKLRKELTPGEKKVLKILSAGFFLHECRPGGWFVAGKKVSGRIYASLLRKKVIVETKGSDYTRNKENRLYTLKLKE